MNKQQKFSIRKYSVGVASVVIGSLLFGSHAVLAEEVVENAVMEKEESALTETLTLESGSETTVLYSNSDENKEETEETYDAYEVALTEARWSTPKAPYTISEERKVLNAAVSFAKKEFFANTLSYESDQKVSQLLTEIEELQKSENEGAFLDKSVELNKAIKINPIRQKYSALKERAYYELEVFRPGWSFESYNHLKETYDTALAIEASVSNDMKYTKKSDFNREEVVAKLSDEVMTSLSIELEKAVNQLTINDERQKLLDMYHELREKTSEYNSLYTQTSRKVARKELNTPYFKAEPRPDKYQEYEQRLAEVEKLLVAVPYAKEKEELDKIVSYYAFGLSNSYISEESAQKLREVISKVYASANEAATLADIQKIQKELEDVIHQVEFLPNNPNFSNQWIKKVTINKEVVDLSKDKYVVVKVELQPNASDLKLYLETSLIDRSKLIGTDARMGFRSVYRRRPLKQEKNIYTFVLPVERLIHAGKYSMHLELQSEQENIGDITVPYTLEAKEGYNYNGKHERSLVLQTSINKNIVTFGESIEFDSSYYWISSYQNTLFDIYKVGENKPIKRIRADINGGNARLELLKNVESDYLYNPTLYSIFKIDDTFTEGEYEIRPADLTDTTMKNRTTVAFDMLDRYVQRFKVVKPHKEHIVLEGTMEKDGVYTFADNDRSTDVKVKLDKNIAEAKNIFALQVEALDGDLPVLGGKAYRAFEVDFIDRDGKVIKFSDAHARIYIPVKEEVVAAYHIKGNSKEAVPFAMSEDKQGVWIDVEHFSTYAIEFASAVASKPTDDDHKVTDLDKNPKPSEGDQQVPPKPDGDNHKVIDLDKDPKPNGRDTQTPPKADGENQPTPTPKPNGNAPVTPGSNGPTTPSQPVTPSKPEAKPAQPIVKPKPKADTAEKPQEAPQPSATVAALLAPAAVAQATPAPKGETLPETGEASTAWFTLASVAVLASLGLVATKRPEDV